MAKQQGNTPVSLRHMRKEIASDSSAYLYVGAATALIFALFGYILGRQADQLADLSETDALTGLFNARGFSSRFNSEIKRARRYEQPLSLLFLDLDGLKTVNDRYGHRTGSDALRDVAKLIRDESRQTDVAARWGGDEFTILAPMTTASAAYSLAERIRGRIEEDAAGYPVTASIGVATHAPNDLTMPLDSALLMRAADNAMYNAKKRGKNTVVAAESEVAEALAQR
jgi:diguanylate cyclase (GGDEF)-like protein